MNYELHHGDCLEVMRTLPDASVDCVLTDPPYGTTACKWDSVIPFEPMWKELKRIAKPKAAICLFGSQPFTSALVMSNIRDFKYQWTWWKNRGTGFANAPKQPLRVTEDIVVFNATDYNPQGLQRVNRTMRNSISSGGSVVRNDVAASAGRGNLRTAGATYIQEFANYPTNLIDVPLEGESHPTQKPVELLRYLIRTYTNEGETVLDFTMGSGSTGVACELEGRKFIGIEKDDEYFRIATERIEGVRKREPLFMEQAA